MPMPGPLEEGVLPPWVKQDTRAYQDPGALEVDWDTWAGCVARALERITDALEARNAIDGQMAAFAELLQKGSPQVDSVATTPDLAPDGLPWGKR